MRKNDIDVKPCGKRFDARNRSEGWMGPRESRFVSAVRGEGYGQVTRRARITVAEGQRVAWVAGGGGTEEREGIGDRRRRRRKGGDEMGGVGWEERAVVGLWMRGEREKRGEGVWKWSGGRG